MSKSFLRRARNVSAHFVSTQSLSTRLTGALLTAAVLVLTLAGGTGSVLAETSAISGTATSTAAPMISQRVDNASRTKLNLGIHPLAQKRYDRGTVESSLQATRVQLMLNRPADREAALKQFIADVHTKGSASYHKWLTPDQFGKWFGPADSDVAAVTAWLQSQGLTVNKVSRGKSFVEFGGTAGQIQSAFGTSIHKYVVKGETHYANSTVATIPSALAPAVKGLVALNNFTMKSQAKLLGSGTFNPKTHKGTANWTYPFSDNSEFFYVAPGDFAKQYDTTPLTSGGTTGTGVTIGIINDSNIDVSLVSAYRTLFGLPTNPPQVIVDGNDPGVNSDSIEAYLDVEQAGAVAPGATIALYVGENTALSAGLDLAAARAVDDDTAQILNLSFGNCEQYLPENAFYAYIWEQAAAQGQTVTVSTGDAGSEQCFVDTDSNGNPVYGLAVNGAASTPFNVAVGGTDFYYSDYASAAANSLPGSFTTFWDTGTNASPTTSILQYIPEQPWNNSQYGFNIVGGSNASTSPAGGGGGVSTLYATPAFQSSVVPAGTVTRALPDVSLFAANGYNYSSYVICASPGDCNSDGQTASPATVTGVGGTSASSPAFAGIMALVVQQYGAQGQADYTLYPLATQFPTAFHDVTSGSNNEPCDGTACTSSSVGQYPATTGYDLASGLGSVDANLLVTHWNDVTFTTTTTALTVSPTTITHGSTVTLTANVTSASATGDVAFTTNAPMPNNKGLGFGALASGVATVTSGGASSNVAVLPGGTYNITAQYEGDGTYAPSTSTAQTITVSPEASTTYVNAFDYYFGTAIANGTATVPYGTSVVIEAQPVGSAVSQTGTPVAGSASSDGAATGNVLFTDGTTTATIPTNANGIAEWNQGTFAVGAHSISAKYSGDGSFNASTSATPATFTVVKGTPFVSVATALSGQQSGSGITVQVLLCNSESSTSGTGCGLGSGLAPTGTVTVSLGSQTQTGTLVPLTAGIGGGSATVGSGNYSSATVTFTSVPAGVSSISASYGGDSNWNTASGSATFSTAAGSALASTTTLSAAPTSGTNNASSITLTSTITGTGSTAPTGEAEITLPGGGALCVVGSLASGSTCSSSSAAFPTTVAVSGTTVTITVTVPGYQFYGGLNQLVAAYSGDTTYAPSTSAQVTVAVDQSDFTLSTQNGGVNLVAGGSGSATVDLNSIAGFSGSINLSCTSSSPAVTCSVPSSVPLNGAATATVTINATASTAMHDPLKRFWVAGGSMALAFAVFLGIPARRRGWRSMLGVMMLIVMTANFGCGGSSSGGSGGGVTVATPTFTPAAGTYSTAQSVTIADSTAGATIYYTTDGSTPTTASSKYSSAISVASGTETINAIAAATGDTTSAVATAKYVITAGTGNPPTTSATNPITHNVTIQVYTASGVSTVVVTGTVATN